MATFNVTYEIVTQESAEYGETDESGFVCEDVTLREAIEALGQTRTNRVDGIAGIEASDSRIGNARWITVVNGMEYETGAYKVAFTSHVGFVDECNASTDLPVDKGVLTMEIDITDLVTDNDMFEFSASRAEMGDDAGRITWRNAREHAKREPLVTTTDQLDEAKRYFAEFGAWSRDEIDAWTPEEVNALLVQHVAGDWRELESLCMGDDGEIEWDKARELSEVGTIGGRIYPCDIEGSAEFGRIFIYIGD